MRTFLIAAALLVTTAPTKAGTILPHLFAERYCTLRSLGASTDDAMAAAMKQALIPGDDWIYVTRFGRQERSDVVEATNVLLRRCPEYAPSKR